jgi:UPF0716 protein FxsA
VLSRLFLCWVVWAVIELAVVVALASAFGLGRTLLILLATFLIGVVVAGSQVKRQLSRLRSGLTTAPAARTSGGWAPITDAALVALGAGLVVIPGLATSAAGLLLLLPPTRAAARPLLVALAARGLGRPLITVAAVGADRYAPGRARGRADFIDGEVVDVTDLDPPALPPGIK